MEIIEKKVVKNYLVSIIAILETIASTGLTEEFVDVLLTRKALMKPIEKEIKARQVLQNQFTGLQSGAEYVEKVENLFTFPEDETVSVQINEQTFKACKKLVHKLAGIVFGRNNINFTDIERAYDFFNILP